jgi:tRNA (guanine9-N1)-methyltransferase
LAVAASVRHARLPIDEEVRMSTRKVLTIDHVFNIVALVAQKSFSWKEALLQVMPKRKGAVDWKSLEDSHDESDVKVEGT